MAGKLRIRHANYYWLDTWVLANVIQLATQDFCNRFLDRKNDPCGRQFDQMTQAARSGQANIAEGNARHSTSRKTEMKLTDVARASLAELASDYQNWLMKMDKVPWSERAEEYVAIRNVKLDSADYEEDIIHNSALHILAQKHKYDKWLLVDDSEIVANCLLILCTRVIRQLRDELANQLEIFREEGGFTEALTTERLAVRDCVEEAAPLCPKCGKPMRKRMAKSGIHAGQAFWSCTDYPSCKGKRGM